jgi:Putative DNA-binding domain
MMDFDLLVAKGEDALTEMVAAQAPETLQLEFKSSNDREPWIRDKRLTDVAKKVLGKALSGVANSAGGILVLGLDARRDEDGVDAAADLRPFQQLRLLETLITQAVSDLLQPKHSTIRVASIPSYTASDTGFVVIDIPRSERRPHRSEASGQKQYFKRTAGATFPMEHYDIEDAFRRQTTPDLILDFQLGTGVRIGQFSQVECVLDLFLVNQGDVTAKQPSMRVQRHSSVIPGSKFGGGMRETRTDGRYVVIPSGSDFVVHPGERRQLEKLTFRVAGDEKQGVSFVEPKGNFEAFELSYILYAEGMRPRTGVIAVTYESVRGVIYR